MLLDLEEASGYVWAHRKQDKWHILIKEYAEIPNPEYTDYDPDTETMQDLGFISYDEENDIYYWFNIDHHNEGGYPVEKPEDILEMLNVNPIVGDMDYDDPDAPTPVGVKDMDALTLDIDDGGIMNTKGFGQAAPYDSYDETERSSYHPVRKPLTIEWGGGGE